jgi:hypothetical protein
VQHNETNNYNPRKKCAIKLLFSERKARPRKGGKGREKEGERKGQKNAIREKGVSRSTRGN